MAIIPKTLNPEPSTPKPFDRGVLKPLRYGEQYVDNLAGCQLLCMARAECAGFELRRELVG